MHYLLVFYVIQPQIVGVDWRFLKVMEDLYIEREIACNILHTSP